MDQLMSWIVTEQVKSVTSNNNNKNNDNKNTIFDNSKYVAVTDTEYGGGRGVFLAHDVYSKDVVISIPHSCIITHTCADIYDDIDDTLNIVNMYLHETAMESIKYAFISYTTHIYIYGYKEYKSTYIRYIYIYVHIMQIMNANLHISDTFIYRCILFE